MGIKQIRSVDRSPAYYLKIEGLPCLYGTVKPPLLTVGTPGGLVEYERRASVVPGEGFDFSRRLIAEDAIIETEVLSVRLAIDEHSTDAWDPVKVFGKLGKFGASAFAQLRTDIKPGDGDLTAEVSTTAGFTIGDFVHIGRETLYVDDILAAPPRLTLKRGSLGTREQAHRTDAAAGVYPAVTKPIVYFRGRRVTIYEAALDSSGSPPSTLDYVERFKGVVVTEPSIGGDGRAHAIKLEIAPITSLLDQPLGSNEPVLRLSNVAHTFDGKTANQIHIIEQVRGTSHLFDLLDQPEHDDGFVFVDLLASEDGIGETALEVFSAVGSTDGSLPRNHPRRVPLDIDGNFAYVTGFDGNVVETEPVHGAWLDSVGIRSRPATERRYVTISTMLGSPQTFAWPSKLVDVISSGFGSESMNGENGGRFRLSLDLTGEVAPALVVSANYKRKHSHNGQPRLTLHLCNNFSNLIDAGIFANGVGDEMRAHIFDANGVADVGRRDFSHQMLPFEVFNLSSSDSDECQSVEIAATIPDRAVPPVYLDTKVASAFVYLGHFSARAGGYTKPESYITLETDPGIKAGTTRAYEFTEDDEDSPKARVTLGPATEVNVDGVPVYRCEIESSKVFGDNNVIADHEGSTRHRLRPVAAFDGLPIGVVLLRLLCSLDGGRITSNDYDVSPMGAGILEEDINVSSFLAIPEPLTGFARLQPVARQEQTIYEAVRGLLRACGYAIDLRVEADGKCRLAASPFGIPNAADVIDALTEADIADSPTPASSAEVAIRNVFNFRSNFDESGEAQLEKVVRDTSSIEAFGEASDIDIDLVGAVLNSDTPGQIVESVKPIFSRLRQEFAVPRRLFTLTIRAGLAAELRIGGTYSLSHRQLLGVDGLGVSNALCRLRSVSCRGFDAVADCEFVFYGFSGAGWGPSANVENIAGNVLTLSVNEYTSGNDEDVDAFLLTGAKVRIYGEVDLDAFQEVTVGSYDKSTRELTLVEAGVDPIDAPAFITPTVYDSSPPELQIYGHFDKVRVT